MSRKSRLIIEEPGHFHATLVQKEMYGWLEPRASVYAPLGAELIEYLGRIARFNSRPADPTAWQLDVHATAEPMQEMIRDRAGDVVVFTGRNRGKIDKIVAALRAGFHVLADKPWIIVPGDLPKLEEALAMAAEKRLAAYDIMTERHEVTSQLQRELVNAAEVFGAVESVRARSVHNLMKVVAGVPLRRPAWFFDIDVAGEGLADVGTHVADLVQWTAFPDQAIDYRRDIQLCGARRWPLVLTREQFLRVTGEDPGGERFDYYCNNSVEYTLRGVPVAMEITWEWEAPPGAGDVYEASFQGTLSRIDVRQERRPEVYVVPGADGVAGAVDRKIAGLQSRWPGLAVERRGDELRVAIPDPFRVGHEEHFAQVTNQFSRYVAAPDSMPAWEAPCMLAKYYVSTKGVEMGKSR
ncbi:MAG TPA: putative oxidoreductase C-terminal domain-containing protein [Candidatus Acidoferrales bacterium]|nr:putative oxidoreductase C-terminal domain-containing protein [Candidatus Acidoferrales bacterium]